MKKYSLLTVLIFLSNFTFAGQMPSKILVGTDDAYELLGIPAGSDLAKAKAAMDKIHGPIDPGVAQEQDAALIAIAREWLKLGDGTCGERLDAGLLSIRHLCENNFDMPVTKADLLTCEVESLKSVDAFAEGRDFIISNSQIICP